jgi:hypothetical protein
MALWLDSLKYAANRRMLRNPRSERLFSADTPALSAVQQRVVAELIASGVAFVPFQSLVEDREQWTSLTAAVDAFVGGDDVQQALASWRTGERAATQKGYLIRAFPRQAAVDSRNTWLRLALEPHILAIANSYYGLLARLLAFDVWYTISDPAERARRGSQKWHRDPEDRNVVKAFLYFSDVTEGSGPLEYVVNSRLGERNCHTTYAGVGWRHSDDEFARIPPADVVRCTGTAGTLVFCDTAGIHRGGYAIDQPRILATWAYTSPASLHPRRFSITDGVVPKDPAAAFAVSGP